MVDEPATDLWPSMQDVRLPEQFRVQRVLSKGERTATLLAKDVSSGLDTYIRIAPGTRVGADLCQQINELNEALRETTIPAITCTRVGRLVLLTRRFVEGVTIAEWADSGGSSIAGLTHIAGELLRQISCLEAVSRPHGNIKSANIIVTGTAATLVDAGVSGLADVFDDATPVKPHDDAPGVGSHAGDRRCLAVALLDLIPALDGRTSSGLPREGAAALRGVLTRLRDGGYHTADAAVHDLEILTRQLAGDTDIPVAIGSRDIRSELAPTVYVERRGEWEWLAREFLNSVENGPRAVIVEGPAGIGKTRLLREIEDWVRRNHSAQCFYVKSEPSVAARPHDVCLRLLTAVVDARPAGFTGKVWRDDGHIVRSNSGTQQIEDAVRALSSAIRGMVASGDRVFITIDDCQFAGEEDLEFLDLLVADVPTWGHGAFLTLVTRDGQGRTRRKNLGNGAPRLSVGPLDRNSTRAVVTSMTGRIDGGVLDGIVDWAEGNPWFAENIVRFLVENGALVPGTSGWESTGELPFPPTVLTARVRSLPAELKKLLVLAATMGFKGRVDTLAAAADLTATSCLSAIDELAKRGLLRHVRIEEEHAKFIFTHDTVREAALSADVVLTLAECHSAIADAMVRVGDSDSFGLAFHLSRAGQASAARPHAIQAARHARRRYSLGVAQEYYEIALGERSETETLLEYGEVLMLTGRYDEARAVLTHAHSLSKLGQNVDQVKALKLLGETYFKAGEPERAESRLISALELLGVPLPKNRFWFAVGILRSIVMMMWPGTARKVWSAGSADVRQMKAAVFGNLFYCWYFHNGIQTAWAQLNQMVLVRSPQAIASERARAYALHALMCGSMLGWRNRARRIGPESIRIREGLSDEWGKAHAICTYGATLVGVGDWEQACELLSTALVIFDRTADHWEANAGLWNRALARFLMGDIEAARSDAVAVCARAESIGDSQAFALASCIEAFATDGVSVSGVRSFDHDSYDIQQSVSLWMAEAMKNLGTGDLLGAMNCLEAAVGDVRRNSMFNTYTVPAFSWRVTVARWLSAIGEPGSRAARMWAWRAVLRSLTLAALAVVYSSERRYLAIEIKNFPRMLSRAYKIDRAMAILKRVLGAIPRPAAVSPEPASAVGPARGQGADQQAAIVESFHASIDAGSVVLADVPARPNESVRVVSGSMLPEHLTWLRQRGHLRTGGEHSCIRFQARPRRYTRFLVFPIEGFAGRFLVGELKGIYPVSESTWKAGRLAQGWLQHLYASERAADAMAMSLIFTEELFRTKLAAELHDDIGQRLSALLMETQRVRRAILQGAASPGARGADHQNGGQSGNGRDVGVAGLNWICEQLAECNEAVRKLVYEASSPTLQQFGLQAAIRDLIEQVQVADKLDVTCEFNATGDLDYGMLSTTTQTACLRIVQEAVTNVIKHADAHSCSVSLTLGREGLVLRIEDDGVGFDKAVKPRGFGLNSMRERATVLGGTMVVDTSVGAGVTLVATLPVDPIRDEGDDGE